MLVKMLFSTPIVALLSFIASLLQSVNFSVIERISLEFIILGQIPGTNYYLQFEHVLIIGVSLLWLPFVIKAISKAKALIDFKVDYIGHIESISI